jgi:hypothetical protein
MGASAPPGLKREALGSISQRSAAACAALVQANVLNCVPRELKLSTDHAELSPVAPSGLTLFAVLPIVRIAQ